jgi:hypothetical protein
MTERPELISWLWTEPGKAALAGALGGIVRWVTLREHWRDGVLSLLVGSICAVYLGPLVAPVLAPVIGKLAPGGDSAGFSSFVVGIGGLSISGLIIDIFRARRAETAGPHPGRADRSAPRSGNADTARKDDDAQP